MKIAEEKIIADAMLDLLSNRYKKCLVAGGAPRDWYLERSCSDIDIFILTKDSLDDVIQYSSCLGLGDFKQKGNLENREYEGATIGLKGVLESEVLYKKIQLVVVEDKTYRKLVSGFPNTISKFWYSDKTIGGFIEARESISTKTIGFVDLYTPYATKIMNKFPEYKAITIKEFNNTICSVEGVHYDTSTT